MELVSIGKFAKMVGVTTTTLRRMHQSGDFIPHHVTKGGHALLLNGTVQGFFQCS